MFESRAFAHALILVGKSCGVPDEEIARDIYDEFGLDNYDELVEQVRSGDVDPGAFTILGMFERDTGLISSTFGL